MRTFIFVSTALLLAGCSQVRDNTLPGGTFNSAATFARHSMLERDASFKAVYSFGQLPDAHDPSSLVELNGTLYGTAGGGGTNKYGAIFSITPSGQEKVLYSFQCCSDPRLAGALTPLNGVLYGTSQAGGAYGAGTVYSVTTSGQMTVLHSFGKRKSDDGATPLTPLVAYNGVLYGTTYSGGGQACNCGTVFSITPSGSLTILHAFQGGADGSGPSGGPLAVAGGLLYGTTAQGGQSGNAPCDCGTVFSMTTSGTTKVLYAFSGASDGGQPLAGLTAVGSDLYGSTFVGGSGSCNCGTIYKITPSGSLTTLHAFTGSPDASNPSAQLTLVKGMLYSSAGGGANNSGSVFKISPTGKEQVVYSFSGGVDPGYPLIKIGNALLGTTHNGGANGFGEVYALTI